MYWWIKNRILIADLFYLLFVLFFWIIFLYKSIISHFVFFWSKPVHRGYLDLPRRPTWVLIKNRNASVSGGPVAELWRHKLFSFYFVGLFLWTLQNREMADMDSPLDFELEDPFQRSPVSRKKRFFSSPLRYFFAFK